MSGNRWRVGWGVVLSLVVVVGAFSQDLSATFPFGSYREVQALLESGKFRASDTGRDSKGATAFLLASAQTKDVAVLKLLVASGANPLDTDYQGWNALHYAAAYGTSVPVLQYLQTLGLTVDARTRKNDTPAMLAVARRVAQSGGSVKPEFLALLLDSPARLVERNDLGHSVLELACEQVTDPEVFRLLFSRGADCNATYGYYDRSPLMLASFSNSNPQIVEFLLNQGAAPRYRTADGETAFSLGSRNPRLVTTKTWLRLKG